MLYTLYNLIGSDSAAWNGGSPYASVKLRIDSDVAVGNFWPWRESEIEKLFRSRPISQYAVEAWDVYENGVFQHTRYLIQSLSGSIFKHQKPSRKEAAFPLKKRRNTL